MPDLEKKLEAIQEVLMELRAEQKQIWNRLNKQEDKQDQRSRNLERELIVIMTKTDMMLDNAGGGNQVTNERQRKSLKDYTPTDADMATYDALTKPMMDSLNWISSNMTAKEISQTFKVEYTFVRNQIAKLRKVFHCQTKEELAIKAKAIIQKAENENSLSERD